MSVNFFGTECTEPPRLDLIFGICDNQDGTKAFSSINNDDHWIATVKNVSAHEVTFTAIDNCIKILKAGTKDKEKSCDGMLTFKDSLYLMELKEKGTGGWISIAKEQLENTIKLISENHDLENYKYKKAYACNKKHPSFTIIEASERRSFFKRTGGFRIDVQAEIVVK